MAIKSYRKLKQEAQKKDGYWVESAKLEFVKGLTKILKSKGITNNNLAKRLDATAPYVTKALRGDENFTIESMVKLTQAIGAKLHIHVSEQTSDVRWYEIVNKTKVVSEKRITTRTITPSDCGKFKIVEKNKGVDKYHVAA